MLGDLIIASPKQRSLSASAQDHVRVAVVTDGGRRHTRADVTVDGLRELLTGRATPAALAAREDLLDALNRAPLARAENPDAPELPL